MGSVGQALREPLFLGVLLYVVVQLAVGVAVSRRIQNESDYLLAGRRLGYGLAIFSLFATWFGAETCVGSAGEVYAGGLSSICRDPLGYGLCLFVMGAVFAVPLWRAGLTTFADLFLRRYGPGVERTAALLLIPTSVYWAAAQIRAFGQVLATCAPGLDVNLAIVLAAVVVLIYTISGGMLADAITDFVQGIALIVGLVIVLAAVVLSMGGPGPALSRITAEQLELRPAGMGTWEWLNGWATPIFGSILATELVSRVLAARSPEVARRSSFAAGGLYLVVGSIPVVLGLLGAHLLPDLDDSESLLPLLAREHLHGVFYVLFAGALVSAILSTVDSALLVAGSLASHNLFLSFKPDVSERAKLRAARLCVLLFGVVATAFALEAESGVALLEEANGFGSAGIVVIACFGLFTRFGGTPSAVASLIGGTGTWIYVHHVLEHEADYLLSLAAALAAYVAVGWVEHSRRPRDACPGACDRAQSKA
ncbi:MAG: sodium:solute symporter family protein [Planctomycetes bacterium]|nr:sodium:solute symporter family protein [Planctomycetota bacterium]